jgi:hypothetical protein
MSTVKQIIQTQIVDNEERRISGSLLQNVLVAMVDRDVFLTEYEYNQLVTRGLVDEDKIYHIYEE